MRPYYIFSEALQAIMSNALRSSLTIVGIVVGIFSVTAMLALGEGVTGNILERFDEFTVGDITVSGELTFTDFAWISDQPYVADVLAIQVPQATPVIKAGEAYNPTIRIPFGAYEAVQGMTVISGVPFTTTDQTFDERVVMVDEGFVTAVTDEDGSVVLGDTVSIAGQPFTIVAILEGGTGGFGRRGDGTIIIPYGAALGVVLNTTSFSSFGINLVEPEYYPIIGQAILAGLNSARYTTVDSDEYFSVTSAQDAIDAATETTAMFTLFLGIVGGIALFVGGIGTMNMMLTTVTERTKEIGLRKAIGARERDILAQILVESVLLTSIGGAFGIGLTYIVAYFANQILTEDSVIQVVMSSEVVLYAALVAVAVGVIFGVYPARNAARLQPVEALRAD